MNSAPTKKPQICSFCVALILRCFVLKIYTHMLYVSKYVCIFFQNFLKRENLNFDQVKLGLHGARALKSIFDKYFSVTVLFTISAIILV